MKKFFVLAVLFVLPLMAYLFFASGVNNFGRLPVLTENVTSLKGFEDLKGNPVSLQDKISILGFFGNKPLKMKGNAFNVNWVIYKPYHEFQDFQFVILLDKEAREEAQKLYAEMEESIDMEYWHFALGDKNEIKNIFNSLGSDLTLDENHATPHVFIIDKKTDLRGRDDDPENGGTMYGYNTSKVGELMNEMDDDVKVILAEYRLELKKYNREI
jgi:hypothetical protein